MQWCGVLQIVLGCLLTSSVDSQVDQCISRCQHVFPIRTSQTEQVNSVLAACQSGCQFYVQMEVKNGPQESLNNLQGCNLSCEEGYNHPSRPACQSGCGFQFDQGRSKTSSDKKEPTVFQSPSFTRLQPIPSGHSPDIEMRQSPAIEMGQTSLPPFFRSQPSMPPFIRSRPPPFQEMMVAQPRMPKNIGSQQIMPTIRRSNSPIQNPLRSEPSRPNIVRFDIGRKNFIDSKSSRPEIPRSFMQLSRSSNPLFSLPSPYNGPNMNGRPGPSGPFKQQLRNLPAHHVNIPQNQPLNQNIRVLQNYKPNQGAPIPPQNKQHIQSPSRPQILGPMIFKQQSQGPTVLGFSLENLISQLDDIAPMHEEDEVDNVVNRVEDLMEQTFPQMNNKLIEIDQEQPFHEFMEDPGMTDEDMFGRNDEEKPFGGLLDGILGGFINKIMNTGPSQMNQMENWMPENQFRNPFHTGQMMVIKAGPGGYHEEKHFDILPNGEMMEVDMEHDALEHENPMDTSFDSNDVEIFHDNHEEVESLKENNSGDFGDISKMSESLMDVRMLEENDQPKIVDGEEEQLNNIEDKHEQTIVVEEKQEQTNLVEDKQEQPNVEEEQFQGKQFESKAQFQELPFLSVLRNTLAENEKLSQELLTHFHRTMAARSQWDNDTSCNSHHLKWSDWVGCLNQRVGVPRWLTALTILLGVIFSVWLCLAIPSKAPKQKLRALIISSDKTSTAAAKAKEAEVVKSVKVDSLNPAVVVDLPPTYPFECPHSPAPSYRSDMAGPVVPGSPAPSYRSVDIPADNKDEDKLSLEPVHGEAKESIA